MKYERHVLVDGDMETVTGLSGEPVRGKNWISRVRITYHVHEIDEETGWETIRRDRVYHCIEFNHITPAVCGLLSTSDPKTGGVHPHTHLHHTESLPPPPP